MTEFAEKAKTIGVSLKRGTARKTRVRDDRDGTEAGLQIEHWDDRQDAIVRPKPLDVTLKVKEGE